MSYIRRMICNRGIVLSAVVLLGVIVFVISDSIGKYMAEDEAGRVIKEYINANISGEYLNDVTEKYEDTKRIETWNGKTNIRWKDSDTILAFCESDLVLVNENTSRVSVSEGFVLEKNNNDWIVTLHTID